MACRYTNMQMTTRYTAPVSLMLLRRCRIQCHNVSTASLTGCARTASNSMPTRRSWCGARPAVSCRNYPAARFLLLVHSFVLSTPFVTWVHVWTTILVRPLTFGERCHAASLHFVSFVTFVNTSPISFPGGVACALRTRLRQLRPGRTSGISTAATTVRS